MYKVFVNQRPLILTNLLTKETDFKVFLLEFVDLQEVIEQLSEGAIEKAHLYHPDKNLLIRLLREKLPVATAGGGLVNNDRGEILFIYRNDRWDLPKGKVEKGERIEATALREIEEETGAKDLVIHHFIGETYHIFKRNGIHQLKHTYWFRMHTSYEGVLTPQTEEGIYKAVWLTPKEADEALKNSYKNIRLLFKEEGMLLHTE